jgi:hypothetical protein
MNKKNIHIVLIFVLILPSLLFAKVEVDDFTTSTIGNEWSANTNAFDIGAGTLKNKTINPPSYQVAIYRNVDNANQATIHWSGSSTTDGVNAAGFAAFMSGNDVATNPTGYFVFLRNGELALHPIKSTGVDRTTHLDVINGVSSPTPGDSVTLKLSYNSTTGVKSFEFLINNVSKGALTTTDVQYGADLSTLASHYLGVVYWAGNTVTYNIQADKFTIKYPHLSVTSPLADASWTHDEDVNILFNASDFLFNGQENVTVLLSVDNGTSFNTLIKASHTLTQTINTIAYKVPTNISSNTCIIKVELIGNTQLFALSQVFKIQSISGLKSPVAGDIWIPNPTKNYFIEWSIPVGSDLEGKSGHFFYSVDDDNTLYQMKNLSTGDITQPLIGDAQGVKKVHWDWSINDWVGAAREDIRSEKVKVYIKNSLNHDETYFESDYFTISTLTRLTIKNGSGGKGTQDTLKVFLKNYTSIKAIQFTFEDNPNNLTTLDKDANKPGYKQIFASGRAKDANFTVTAFEDAGSAKLNILMLNLLGNPIPAGDGQILEIPIKVKDPVTGDNSNLRLTNVKIIDGVGGAVFFADGVDNIDGIYYFVTPGDVTGDNLVLIDDYNIVLKHVIGAVLLDPVTDANKILSADVNNDDKIDMVDLMLIWDML